MASELSDAAIFFAWLKNTSGGGGVSVVIPVGTPVVAYLRPIATNPSLISSSDVTYLTDWRNQHVKRFLTEFIATPEQTRNWLVNTVGPDSGKILFMVVLPNSETIGHIGLGFINWEHQYGEADAIVRGKDAPKGLMKSALQTALSWARDQLHLNNLCVRVRSDNPAVDFYRKVGFSEVKRVPLDVEYLPGMTRWFESPSLENPQASLVYMHYQP
jgi:RimJ/RimL family protein N-acetyltransferase